MILKKIVFFNSIVLCIILIISIIFTVIYTIPSNKKREQYSYSPDKALQYSYEYINKRNSQYPNFQNNCITYISQCLVAGGLEMDSENKNEDLKNTIISKNNRKWFCYSFDDNPNLPIKYHLSSSFTNHKDFIDYWTNVGDVNMNTIENTKENRKELIENTKEGDVIILHGKNTHSAIITHKTDIELYYNSNTNDRMDYPLSKVESSEYSQISYLNFVK